VEADDWGVETEKGEYEQDAEAYELFHQEAKGIAFHQEAKRVAEGGGICVIGVSASHVVFGYGAEYACHPMSLVFLLRAKVFFWGIYRHTVSVMLS
jgi:hypothetical protein